MKNETVINMSGSIFSDLKRDMTMTMQDAIAKMKEVGSDTATVSVKIKIELDKTPVTSEKDYRDADVPKFKHKVEYSVPVKDSREGEIGGEYELIHKEGQYGLKPLDGQTSMFDDEDEDTEEDDDE